MYEILILHNLMTMITINNSNKVSVFITFHPSEALRCCKWKRETVPHWPQYLRSSLFLTCKFIQPVCSNASLNMNSRNNLKIQQCNNPHYQNSLLPLVIMFPAFWNKGERTAFFVARYARIRFEDIHRQPNTYNLLVFRRNKISPAFRYNGFNVLLTFWSKGSNSA
jgi:hypothetical protein